VWQDEVATVSLVEAHQGAVYQLFRHQADVWIGGQNGFARLNAAGYQWYQAPVGLPELQISELAIQGNDLYLGSNIGLFRWQRRQWQQLALPEPTETPRIEMLYLDPQQQLWVSSYNKLYRVQNGALQPADFALGKQADFVWIESMLQDQHGNLWLGSHAHGLKRLRKPPTQRFSEPQGIPHPYVWAVMGWRQHLLVGTTSGLALLQNGQFQPLTANSRLASQFVYSLLLDSKQRLWAGTRAGLSLLDGNTLAWQRNFDTISDLLVTSLTQENERIWVGTNGGLYFVQQDALSQQGLPEVLVQAKVRTLLADSKRRLWIGTENGLYLRDETGFHEVTDVPVSGRFISSITEFTDGNILIGSFDYGFLLGQPGHWRWLSQKDGLPGNGVLDAELIDGQLLISNFQGFYRVNYADLLVNKVTNLYLLVDDRRPEAATDSHRCCNGAGSSKGTVHQGRLWYPTLDGVISLPLQQLVQYGQVPDPVIQSVTANGELLRGAQIKLTPAQRDWHFRFTTPYFVQASSVMFRYRLKGYDEQWIDAANRREAFYTNLPPGQYQFELQVRVAADYRWSEPVKMTLTLSPFWYETLFARV
ncbi:MAG TPA: two-component regulator propeller domain-containing protein, partial [Rheinheimera sp.]|nr:two-component regulator propeller domain-containing protein [Rheinheimera sp.]